MAPQEGRQAQAKQHPLALLAHSCQHQLTLHAGKLHSGLQRATLFLPNNPLAATQQQQQQQQQQQNSPPWRHLQRAFADARAHAVSHTHWLPIAMPWSTPGLNFPALPSATAHNKPQQSRLSLFASMTNPADTPRPAGSNSSSGTGQPSNEQQQQQGLPGELLKAGQNLATAGPPPPAYLGSYQDLGFANVTSREELGRSTWTLLHVLAAQFPERPSRQQRKDAYQLIDCLTRIYPCSECAQHFQEIVKRDPPQVGSGRELQQWMCRVHNTVNRSLNKPMFNCELVSARWAPLSCEQDEGASACDMGNWGLPK